MGRKKCTLQCLIYTILSVLLGCFAWSLVVVSTPLHTLLPNGNANYEYKLYDLEDPIDPYMEDLELLSVLKNYYTDVRSLSDYHFYEKIKQPLKIQYFTGAELFSLEKEEGDLFSHNEVTYVTVNQVLMNHEALLSGNIQIQSGSGMDENAYRVSEDYMIPVILGYDYIDYFEVGDILTALNYYETVTKMKVYGFAKKGTCVTIKGENVVLDNYIISASPTFDFVPSTADEARFHALLYFQKIDGAFTLKEHTNNIKVLLDLNRLRLRNDAFPMYIIGYIPIYQEFVCAIGSFSPVIVLLCAALLLAFSFVCRRYVLLRKEICLKECLSYEAQTFTIMFLVFLLGKLLLFDLDFLVTGSLVLTLLNFFFMDGLIILLQTIRFR